MYMRCRTTAVLEGRCDLCLTEKFELMREDRELLLNKQSELVSKCCNKNKFILANIK